MNKTIKNIGAIVLVFGLMAGVFPVMAEETSTAETLAQEATFSDSSGTVKSTIKNIKEVFKGKKEDVVSSIKAKNEERIKKIKGSFLKIKNRFDANIKNLESLSVRISSRIDKLEQKGKDVAEAKVKLDEAKVKIQEAKDAVSKLQQDIEAAIASDESRKYFGEIKSKIEKEVVVKIKATHKALVDVVIISAKLSGSSETIVATSTIVTSTVESVVTSTIATSTP